MPFPLDHLILTPDDIDLARSPLAGRAPCETVIRGVFNPGLTRLDSGRLLLMARVAEAAVRPVHDGGYRALRWTEAGYAADPWPIGQIDTSDPRSLLIAAGAVRMTVPTSLSWLLPVELDADGRRVEAIHYDRAIAPAAAFQSYGIEDPRIVRIDGGWWMTACAMSPERISTILYRSDDGIDWRFADMLLDHHNRDMALFEGRIDGCFWAQTRPVGEQYIAYPATSEWRAGPAINLATSPDGLHWKPHIAPGIRPHSATASTARMGAGAPPIRVDDGWLSLWHGVEPHGATGRCRTYWSLLDGADPVRVVRTAHPPLLSARPALTEAVPAMRLTAPGVVFTTGAVDGGDHLIVASGEADFGCRITHIPRSAFADGVPG